MGFFSKLTSPSGTSGGYQGQPQQGGFQPQQGGFQPQQGVGFQPGYGQPGLQQQQQQPPPPQQYQYGAAPPAYQQEQQPPPQQPQQGYEQGYGSMPAGGAVTPAAATGPGSDFVPLLRQNLTKMVTTNSLQAFYPPQRLEEVLARLAQVDFRALGTRWNMPAELAIDVAAISLYNVIIMADDSTSMKYADHGTRISDLNNILARVAEVACLFDNDGISVRAINSIKTADGVRTAMEADAYIKSLKFSGATALGTAIEQRVITPFVVQPAQQNRLAKPVLLITITDGEPTNEPERKIFQVVKHVKDFMSQTPYGPSAIAFEFAQVGKDQQAQEFLGKLDNDPVIGRMVDATSYYELEAMEYQKKGVVLTPDLWMVKLMVGAIDPSYDEQD